MGFPAGVQTVILTGRVNSAAAVADRDTITITQTPERVSSGTYDFIAERKEITVIPDRSTGTWAVRLLATDATSFNPEDWTYLVQIGASTPFSIGLPASLGPSVDITDLIPASADPGVYDLLIRADSLGEAALLDVGTTAGTVAAGDDARFGNANPWQFNIEDYGAVGDATVVHDGAVVGGTAAVTCATSSPFLFSHIGKPILIKGAGAAGVTSFRTTISGRTSSSRVTLTDTPPVSITNAVVTFGTNNYTAIRAATAAAEAYLNGTGIGVASTPHTYARVYTPPRPYIIDGPLDSTKSGNGQIVFGVYPTDQVKKILEFSGETDGAAAVRHWQQEVPQFAGSCWLSFGFYASTSAQITDINAHGNPGVISGPCEGAGYGKTALYSNVMAVLKNMAILNAHTAFGITYGIANFFGCANSTIENVGGGTMGVVTGTDYASPGTFGTGLSVGLLLPANGNNDHNIVRNLSIGGGYTYGLFLTEHGLVDRYMALYCWAGLCPVGTYNGSVGATHAMKVLQASIEACGREIYFVGPGSQGVTIFDCDQLQTESSTPTIDGNSTGALAAAVGRIKLTGLFTEAGVNFTQPCGVELVNGQVPRAIKRRTSGFAVGPLDRTLICDTTASGFTATLPVADFCPVRYAFKNTGTNTLTLATVSSQKIDEGGTTATLSAGASVGIEALYNGSAWGWYRV